MKALFDSVSYQCSQLTTNTYSTSFSLGIRFLDSEIRNAVHSVYGFVRLADEIVDSFHGYDKRRLLEELRQDTYKAIEQGISLNPILNSFQATVTEYQIDLEFIDTFLNSMEMDLDDREYDQKEYEKYILGSAEVVGLMCLNIFTLGDQDLFLKLKPNAMKLGSAFQKINFLRDIKEDYNTLGRNYFPDIDISTLTEQNKIDIEMDIKSDFKEGFKGILGLPKRARFGVYLAYVYYYGLFKKIQSIPSKRIMKERIRIPNTGKYFLFMQSYIRHNIGIL
ncbi:MAG: phytoene synthase [Crocinitomicaceae bacterium]|nr:phytoene synthase [Crocinitomicaceae bacterium]|tara:strand:- start:4853 stop:5689 length:837 start_codon:yes stop_codon:yes gene_type:complete